MVGGPVVGIRDSGGGGDGAASFWRSLGMDEGWRGDLYIRMCQLELVLVIDNLIINLVFIIRECRIF
jgi:hypothetical protein